MLYTLDLRWVLHRPRTPAHSPQHPLEHYQEGHQAACRRRPWCSHHSQTAGPRTPRMCPEGSGRNNENDWTTAIKNTFVKVHLSSMSVVGIVGAGAVVVSSWPKTPQTCNNAKDKNILCFMMLKFWGFIQEWSQYLKVHLTSIRFETHTIIQIRAPIKQ